MENLGVGLGVLIDHEAAYRSRLGTGQRRLEVIQRIGVVTVRRP